MLVKRPIQVGDDFVLVGFRDAEWSAALDGKYEVKKLTRPRVHYDARAGLSAFGSGAAASAVHSRFRRQRRMPRLTRPVNSSIP